MPHSKYGYTPMEQFLMLIVTGITNFATIPTIIHIYRRKMYFESSISLLTLCSSFLYHSMDSVDVINLFLTDLQWHRIDNIGSIQFFIMLMVYLMDNQNPDIDLQMNFVGLFVALICQEKSPWDIEYTLFPILSYLLMAFLVCLFRKRKPKYNRKMVLTGLGFFCLAFIGFFKGLDEFTDYLRIYHGMWHMAIGIGSFFIWQSKTPVGDEFTLTNLFRKPVYQHKYAAL